VWRGLDKVEKVAVDNQLNRVRPVRQIAFQETYKMALQFAVKVIQRGSTDMQIADNNDVSATHHVRILLQSRGSSKRETLQAVAAGSH
jgi:hypothetical protein